MTHSGRGWVIHEGEALSVLRSLRSDSVDAVITDPPYSSGGMFRGDRARDVNSKYEQSGVLTPRPSFAGDSKDQRAWMQWSTEWMTECRRVALPGAPICVFTDWRQLPATTDALQWADWVWRGIAVWDKTEGTRPQLASFRSQAEYVVWGTNGPRAEAEGVPVLPGVLRQVVLQGDKHHLTGKPTPVMRWLAQICRSGGVILDPFMDSGTTGVAAVEGGWSFVGVEREPHNVEVSRTRIGRATFAALRARTAQAVGRCA